MQCVIHVGYTQTVNHDFHHLASLKAFPLENTPSTTSTTIASKTVGTSAAISNSVQIQALLNTCGGRCTGLKDKFMDLYCRLFVEIEKVFLFVSSSKKFYHDVFEFNRLTQRCVQSHVNTACEQVVRFAVHPIKAFNVGHFLPSLTVTTVFHSG